MPPNTRVQRTRVARCARPGSPLTRHPLGSLGAAFLLCVASCVSSQPDRPVVLTDPERQVCGEALRTLFQQPAYPGENPKPRACVSYLTILQGDPPAGFIERIDNLSCELRPGSKFKQSPGNGFVTISKIEWTDPDHVVIDGSIGAAVSSSESMARGWQLNVTRSGNGWVAGPLRSTWIS